MKTLLTLFLFYTSTVALLSESRFQVLYNKRFYYVNIVKNNAPVINVDGKEVIVEGAEMRLVNVGYDEKIMQRHPKWAYVRKISSQSYSTEFAEAPLKYVNNSLDLKYELKTVQNLKNVYAVAFLESESGDSGYIVRSIGDVVAFEPQMLDFSTALQRRQGNIKILLAVFSDGKEIRHSLSNRSDFAYGMGSGTRSISVGEQVKVPKVYSSFPPVGIATESKKIRVTAEFDDDGSVRRTRVISEIPEKDKRAIEKAVLEWWFVPVAEGKRMRPGGVDIEIDCSDLSHWSRSSISVLSSWIVPIEHLRSYARPPQQNKVPEIVSMNSTEELAKAIIDRHAKGFALAIFSVDENGIPYDISIDEKADAILAELALSHVKSMRFSKPNLSDDNRACRLKLDFCAE